MRCLRGVNALSSKDKGASSAGIMRILLDGSVRSQMFIASLPQKTWRSEGARCASPATAINILLLRSTESSEPASRTTRAQNLRYGAPRAQNPRDGAPELRSRDG